MSSKSTVIGGWRCVKYFLMIFTIITFISGAVVLAVGLYTLLTDFGSQGAVAVLGTDLYEASSYILVVGGSVILLVSVCGCSGALKENRQYLCCYFGVLIILLSVFISAGVLGFIFRERISSHMETELKSRLTYKYGVDLNKLDNLQFTQAWDRLQRKIMCCGISGELNSWGFYKNSTVWYQQFTSGKPYVPESCCDPASEMPKCQGSMPINGPPSQGPPVTSSMMLNMGLYTDGCYDKIKHSFEMNSILIGAVALATLGNAIFGILLSTCLFRHLGDDYVV